MKHFWFICSMCQNYRAHAFLIGCAGHPVMACSQLCSSVLLPTLFPTLVELLPALAHSAVLVCTHRYARAPVLRDHGESAQFAILHGAPKRGGHVCEA